ncbi:MAG: hypothetical protein OXT65_08545 [Alphaproteobacteria bacterium]|nr:hypothetical protein [Alphaproteobacteria bacterium]
MKDIALHYNVLVPLVLQKIKGCRKDRARPGIRIDGQKKIEWRIERRSVQHTHMECLHASQLEAFGKTYRLDTPYKTDEWLTRGEIAERLMQDGLRQVDGSAVSSVFARLKIKQNTTDLRYDPKTMKEWRIGKKRHKLKIIICLHTDDFDGFCREYRLDALEYSHDFLSPLEISKQMGQTFYTYPPRIEKYLKACLDQDNMMGKHLSHSVEYRYVCGSPQPCLRRNALPAFIAFQKAEAARQSAEQQARALNYREERRRQELKSW